MVRITSLIGAAALFSTSVLAVPQLVARTGSSSYGSSDSSSSYDNSGYSGDSSSGYGSSNSGYGSSNSGYSSNNSGYGSSNSGYSSNDSGYGSSNSGYGSSNSGYGSSNSGYDSSNNSGYGSSNSGYGSSNNGYGSDSGYSGSDNYNTYTTTASTSIALSTSTSTIVYGSGSSNYGSGYDDCVQQCIASFAPSATGVYNAPTVDSGSSGSYGTGATKTIIVAPTQGVLRYVPFATNASIGDTIKFVWGANEHTVTKSSEFLPCNKTSDSPFASGEQNQGFVFTQVINSTDPLYFYCGTPNHCQAGMFAVINPPSSLNSPTSASGMMQSLSAQNADLKAYAALTDKATDGSAAAEWGGNIDLANVPGWAQPLVAENILYTRNLLASNPELMQTDGSIDLGSIASTPLMVPVDVAQALANAGPVPSTPAVATSVAGAAETSAPSTPNGYNNGAGSLTSPRALVGLTVVLATVFML